MIGIEANLSQGEKKNQKGWGLASQIANVITNGREKKITKTAREQSGILYGRGRRRHRSRQRDGSGQHGR